MRTNGQGVTNAPASVGKVLNVAWDKDAFTASDVIELEALSRATAIEAIDTLVALDVLEELPNARSAGQYRSGRPARRFQLKQQLGVVVGVDAGDHYLSAIVTDLTGNEISRIRRNTAPSVSPATRAEQVVTLVRDVLESTGQPRQSVLALCAGVPAPVTKAGESPKHEMGFWDRTNPHLDSALSPYSELVEIRNDATLAAIAEAQWGEAIGVDNYVALLAGERFGAGVVVDGHALFGAHGGVGEMVFLDYVTDIGSASGLGLVLRGMAAGLDPVSIAKGEYAAAQSPELTNAEVILARAAAGEPEAQALADEAGAALGLIVAVLSNIYDPDRVIICGAVAMGVAPVLPAARRRAAELAQLPTPEIVASTLGAEVVLRGALASALHTARTRALPAEVERRLKEAKSPLNTDATSTGLEPARETI